VGDPAKSRLTAWIGRQHGRIEYAAGCRRGSRTRRCDLSRRGTRRGCLVVVDVLKDLNDSSTHNPRRSVSP